MAVPLRRGQVGAVFEVCACIRASLQAGVAFDAGGELWWSCWVLIEVVALRHAGETAPHLAGRRRHGGPRDRGAAASVFTGLMRSPSRMRARQARDRVAWLRRRCTDSQFRAAAVAKREVWHLRCLSLQEHVEDHRLLVRIAACIVVFHDGSLTVAVGFDLDLHAARFSATAASSEPGSTSGAAPRANPRCLVAGFELLILHAGGQIAEPLRLKATPAFLRLSKQGAV